jgi:hypothetical protein
MPRKQHIVRLTAAERAALTRQLNAGAWTAHHLMRARIVLKADAGAAGPRLTDRQIAEAVEVSARTVARTRADFAAGGVVRALTRQPRRATTPRLLDQAAEQRLIAVATSLPPAGFARWSLRLLATKVVELEIAPHICAETVRQTLKKTCSSPGV